MNNEFVISDHPNMESVIRGRRLEYVTIIWNSLEGIIAVGAGIVAGSIALVGFGVDSVIEVSSGAIILCRLERIQRWFRKGLDTLQSF